MQNLININKILKEIHELEPGKPLTLPQIVLLGAEGSGKSSFIQSFISLEFFPKNVKTVTNLPIKYRLINGKSQHTEEKVPYSFALQLGSRIDKSYEKIEELKTDLTKLLSTTENDDCDALEISITGQELPDLTLVELPSASPTESIYSPKFKAMQKAVKTHCKQTQNMVFVVFFDALIDVSASYTYSLLQELDPRSERSIGVLSKMDLPTSSSQKQLTNQLLSGKLFPIRNGYVALNCTHSMSVYKSEWSNPLNKICRMLSNTFRVTLPQLHTRLQERLARLEQRAKEIGEPLKLTTAEKARYAWGLSGDFCYKYRESLSGKYEGFTNQKIQELCLGAIIRMFYHELYDTENSFFQEPKIKMTADDVLQLIERLNNSSMDGFISIDAFLYMVGPYLDALMEPVKDLLLKVHECMLGLADKILGRLFFQFPNLNQKLSEAIKGFITQYKNHTETLITQVMEANKTYFFTSDREFLRIDLRKLQAVRSSRRASQDLSHDMGDMPPESGRPSRLNKGESSMMPERSPEEILLDNQRFLAEEIYRRVRKYYLSIKDNLKDTIPRLVGCFMIKPVSLELQNFVNDFLTTTLKEDPEYLFKEDEENVNEREQVKSEVDKIRKFRRNLLRDTNFSRLIREDYLEKYTKQHQNMIKDEIESEFVIVNDNPADSERTEQEALDMRMSTWLHENKAGNKPGSSSNNTQVSKKPVAPQNMKESRTGRGRAESRTDTRAKRARTAGRKKGQQEEQAEKAMSTMTSRFVIIDNYLNKDQKFRESVLTKEEWLKVIDSGTLESVPLKKLWASAVDGFPPELRYSIWMLLANVKSLKQQHPKNYYDQLIENQNKWEVQIEKDIPRTYAGENFFKKPEYEAKETLFRILRAYANFDEELGYTQGMNGIAGMLLMILSLGHEEIEGQESKIKQKSIEKSVFWIFVHIMKEKGWRRVLTDGTPKLIECCINLDKMLQKELPEIYQKIEDMGLNVDICFNQYFVTMLVYNTPMPLAMKIIDLFLIRGEAALFEIMIKTLTLFKKDILAERRMEVLFNFLKTDLMQECFKRYRQTLDKVMPELSGE